MTKKIYQEIMSQAVASTNKLATQLKAYPYNQEEVQKSLEEVIKYVNEDIKHYQQKIIAEALNKRTEKGKDNDED